MAAAGLGWREVLASLTISPARRFGERATRGTVERGMAADLVVLVVDSRAGALEAESFARVRYTIRGGRVIYDAGESTDAATVAELKGLQNRLRDALLNGRRDEYASLLAHEWRVTHVDGRVLTKADVLQQMFGGPSPLADVTADQIEVRLFGDAAVTTGRTIATARDGSRVWPISDIRASCSYDFQGRHKPSVPPRLSRTPYSATSHLRVEPATARRSPVT
jgi:hypothetical protein